MTNGERPDERFGCVECWPSAADAAWEARRALRVVEELIDESHFHVMILSCGRCGQRFLSIFTEMIDWADGDDPQYWTLLPITEAEAGELAGQGESLSDAQLGKVGPGRRCLRRNCPKGAAAETVWGSGVWVGRHD